MNVQEIPVKSEMCAATFCPLGTGLQIHEMPRMSPISDEILAPGMIITVEPGVYYDGDFGIRIEDDVLVTESGHEVLSTLPKGLDDCRFIL